MRSLFLKSALVLTVLVSWSGVPAAERAACGNDRSHVQVHRPAGVQPRRRAVRGRYPGGGDLRARPRHGRNRRRARRRRRFPAFDQKIAALLGTDVREITVTDLAVHPKTRNAFVSVMRGQGNNAAAGAAARSTAPARSK